MLENTLRLAEELHTSYAPAEQIVDSTPMLRAAATQHTVNLFRHFVKKLIHAVAAIHEQTYLALFYILEFYYAKPAEKPYCR